MQRLLNNQAATGIGGAPRLRAAATSRRPSGFAHEVLAVAPDDGGAWALLTETALQRGRPDAAIVCANRAVALTPADPIAPYSAGQMPVHLRRTRQALAAAEAASRIVGDAPEALDALGAIFGLLGLHATGLGACSAAPSLPVPTCRNISSIWRRPNA